MDRLQLRNLTVDTVIGVHEWERRNRQCLLLDLDLPMHAANIADDLSRALDYDAVACFIRAFAKASDRKLIETFAEELAAALLDHFALPWLILVVTKPGAVAGCDIRVRIRRSA